MLLASCLRCFWFLVALAGPDRPGSRPDESWKSSLQGKFAYPPFNPRNRSMEGLQTVHLLYVHRYLIGTMLGM